MENTKENQFSVPKKYVMKEKKTAQKTTGIQEDMGNKKQHFLSSIPV